MKSQDIVILLKLILLHQSADEGDLLEDGKREAFSARGLERSLGISKSEVNASINRSANAGLVVKDRKSGIPKANVSAVLELITHGLKYVFPVKPGALVRGMPTAAAAPIMQGELKSMEEQIYVWPDPQGEKMGQALKPLFRSVPHAARHAPALYDLLALVDAIRLGNPRESKVAQQLLEQRLKQ
ncbi:MAG: hypothetical protein ABW168_17220 [Sedimenticola sp.]